MSHYYNVDKGGVMKYQSKPVTVEAAQLTAEACRDYWDNRVPFFGCNIDRAYCYVQTSKSSSAKVLLGEWVVVSNGRVSVLSAAEFEAMYEPIASLPGDCGGQ